MIGLLACAVRVVGPSAVATASKSEVSVGEVFTVEVRASGPPGCTFTFPGEVNEESVALETAQGAAGVHTYRASVFALEDAQVPPITVGYRLAGGEAGEVKTAALPIHVVTLLPKQKDEQKLADVRAPVRLTVGRAFWIGVGVLAALLLALAVWLWLRRRPKAAPAVVVPEISADEEARQALRALAASGRLEQGEYRPFYIALTSIAKRYLERRLQAPIVEMTTAEMLAFLRHAPHTSEMGPLLRDLSGAADRIKFARGLGAVEEGQRHLAAVDDLVVGLERRLAPPTPDSGRAA